MTTYRNGKIARLPKMIRDELNHRLAANAERGPKLLAWLNTHPDVQKVLADQFESRPISQQNLSEWRRGGYEDWLELQEKNHLTLQMLERAGTFAADLNPQKINAALATIAAAESAHTALAKLKACTDTDQRWQCLDEIEQRLSRRLRNDFRTGNLALRREKWDYKLTVDKLATEQAATDEERRQELAFFQLQPKIKEYAKQFPNVGGDDQARDLSAYILELEHNLNQGTLGRKCPLPDSDPEGRVPRVPNITPPESNIEHAESSISSEPSPSSIHNPASSIGSDPLPPGAIALANDCTPEEFAARNHPHSTDGRMPAKPWKNQGKQSRTKRNSSRKNLPANRQSLRQPPCAQPLVNRHS